jgi:translation initiation factor 3 subunit B
MVPIPPENQQDGLVLDENGHLDFTDLEAEYEVPFESGFDSVIIVDNCPVVKEDDKKGKLMNYIRRTFSAHGTIKDDGIYMPMVKGEDDEPTSQGYVSCGASNGRYVFIEFATPEQASVAIKARDGYSLDKRHKLRVNRLTDVEKYARAPEEYVEPDVEPYAKAVFSLSGRSDNRNICAAG